MENDVVKDVYGDEASVEVVANHWVKDEHPGPLVLLACNCDMMMTPEQARQLAADLIAAADACE